MATKLWGLAGLEFASQLAGHCAAAAKRDDSPPRPAPHRVLNNAHYRDIESLFKSRRGAAECPDRKDERSEIARGERSGTTDDRPDNGQTLNFINSIAKNSNFVFFLRIFDEIFSGFRAKFQKIVTCVAFSIKFAKTNQKFAENSEFCEKNSLL